MKKFINFIIFILAVLVVAGGAKTLIDAGKVSNPFESAPSNSSAESNVEDSTESWTGNSSVELPSDEESSGPNDSDQGSIRVSDLKEGDVLQAGVKVYPSFSSAYEIEDALIKTVKSMKSDRQEYIITNTAGDYLEFRIKKRNVTPSEYDFDIRTANYARSDYIYELEFMYDDETSSISVLREQKCELAW